MTSSTRVTIVFIVACVVLFLLLVHPRASGIVTAPESTSTTSTTSTTTITLPGVAVVASVPERGTQVQVTPTLPPPRPVGILGLPLAPDGLDGCARADYYRAQFGLPERFNRVIWLESRCRNEVSSWCCHGFTQIHRLWVKELAHCDIDEVADFLGTDPIDEQRNLCAAAHVYAVQGGEAWVTWNR